MKSLAIFIFPGIQTLDLFGPIEMLGAFPDHMQLTLVAETAAPVTTRHGQRIVPDATSHDGTAYDMLLIPGGVSAIDAGHRAPVIDWLSSTVQTADTVMTVCTGSILLAMTGALDGVRATTNKQDFRGTIHHGPNVDWVPKARWVKDGKFYTSSGVSAGIDMSLGVIADLITPDAAEEQAIGTEYEWHRNASWDPFAERCGLV